jgi:hypothetical protein
LDILAGEYSETVEVVEVSADLDTETAGHHRVRAVPTLIALDGDLELTRHVGRGSEQDRIIRSLSGLGVITIALLAGVPWLAIAGAGFIFAGWWDLLSR